MTGGEEFDDDPLVAASLRAQFETAQAVAEFSELREILPRVLGSFCDNLQWDVGAFWIVEHEVLYCAAFHGTPETDAFREITLKKRLRRGEGSPGRVWASEANVTVDLRDPTLSFPRREAALSCGLQFGLALPVKVQGQIFGTLEFFRRTPLLNTDLHLESARSIARQIGQSLAARAQHVALQFSEVLHKSIYEVAPDGILTMDQHSTILSVNSAMCRIFGYSADELVGANLTKLMSPEIAERHNRGMKKYLESGQRTIAWRGLELPGLHKNGTIIPLEVAFDELPISGPRYFTGFIKDVSEKFQSRKELEDLNRTLERKVLERTHELTESNQELETFVFAVAHDLRAPLRAISSIATLIREDSPQIGHPASEYLHRIEQAALRMDTLLLDLLRFTRVSKAKLHLRPVQLEAVIASALQQLPEASSAVKSEGQFDSVIAEPVLLEQILINLLTNALKFVERGVRPSVTISSETTEDLVRLRVKDNGIGIEPQHQAKIFDLFTKLHSPADFPGTGVGLAISKRGVERLGGSLSVESRPGEGSTFTVTLKRSGRSSLSSPEDDEAEHCPL